MSQRHGAEGVHFSTKIIQSQFNAGYNEVQHEHRCCGNLLCLSSGGWLRKPFLISISRSNEDTGGVTLLFKIREYFHLTPVSQDKVTHCPINLLGILQWESSGEVCASLGYNGHDEEFPILMNQTILSITWPSVQGVPFLWDMVLLPPDHHLYTLCSTRLIEWLDDRGGLIVEHQQLKYLNILIPKVAQHREYGQRCCTSIVW